MAKIKVVFKRPGEEPEQVEVENELKPLMDLVGGYIECVPWDLDTLMIMDEDGKTKGLGCNFGWCGDIIVGPVVWVGIDGEEFADVDPDVLYEVESFTGWHRYDLDGDTAGLEDLIQTALGGEPIPLGGEESEQDND